jgi:hypothetical protein
MEVQEIEIFAVTNLIITVDLGLAISSPRTALGDSSVYGSTQQICAKPWSCSNRPHILLIPFIN